MKGALGRGADVPGCRPRLSALAQAVAPPRDSGAGLVGASAAREAAAALAMAAAGAAASGAGDIATAVARARIVVQREDPADPAGPAPPLGTTFVPSKNSPKLHQTKLRGKQFSEQEWMAVSLTWADTVNSCHCSTTQLGSRRGCIDWPLLLAGYGAGQDTLRPES